MCGAFALSKLCEWPSAHKAVTKLAYLRIVVGLSKSHDVKLQFCAASVLASLAATQNYATSILDAGALAALVPLAVSPSVPVQAQACRALRHLVGGRHPWLKRLRTMCAGADETYARSVWPLRRATVLANVPRTLGMLDVLRAGGEVSSKDVGEWLDVVYRSLGYEDANDMSLKWEEEEEEEEEEDIDDDDEGYSSASDTTTENDEEEEEEERVMEEESQDSFDWDGSSAASARETPRTSRKGGRDPLSLSDVGGGLLGGGGGGGDDEAEREMKRGRGPEVYEYWGKDFSSFTHKKIVCGIRALTDWDAEQEILREATSIASVEVMTTLVHLCSTELPFLVIELKRLHTVEILNKESSSSKSMRDKEEALQEYSLTACRPIEATMTVLNNLKREALVLGRELASEARERRRMRVAPWEYYASNPMELEESEAHSHVQEAASAANDAPEQREGSLSLSSGEAEVEMKEEESQPLRDFLATYHEHYVTETR